MACENVNCYLLLLLLLLLLDELADDFHAS